MKRLTSILLAGFCALSVAASADLFEQGRDLFAKNKPRDAIPLLEASIAQTPANGLAWVYLGFCYEQVENVDKAIATYRKGLEKAVTSKDVLSYNLANGLFRKGDFSGAESFYTQALEANAALFDALLNRANTLVKLERYPDAVRDYQAYLLVQPATPQRASIEKMMTLLGKAEDERVARKAEEERQARLAEEQRLARAEAERLAAEKARRDEEARQKALLESVMQSLQASTENTRNLSAGREEIRVERQETDIED